MESVYMYIWVWGEGEGIAYKYTYSRLDFVSYQHYYMYGQFCYCDVCP
jgi:hypothetical protein